MIQALQGQGAGQGRLALIAAGGTGGHMFPAQALAEALLADGWRVVLSTDERGARYAGGFPAAVVRRQVASASTARGGVAGKIAAPFRIARGVLSAMAQMRADRPAVVVGFGGYPSIPALTAARLLRIPAMIHEQNGVVGRVNRIFAPRVAAVACGTWPTALPQGVEASHTGNPVRASVLAVLDQPYQPPGEGGVSILVIGGSQGARILSDSVAEAIAALPASLRQRLTVTHQLRPEDLERVRATYAAAGIPAEVASFFDDVPARMARAQLVIARAGASSVAEITAIGRPAILVPYAAAAGDHQSANARPLHEAGAAIAIAEPDFTPARLTGAITEILTDPDRAARMSAAARALGRPDAAARLHAIVKDLAR